MKATQAHKKIFCYSIYIASPTKKSHHTHIPENPFVMCVFTETSRMVVANIMGNLFHPLDYDSKHEVMVI